MKIIFLEKSKKNYQKLPLKIREKAKKKLILLAENMFHPSLRVKRMGGKTVWEGSVDRSYRFTFEKENDALIIRTIGPHDEGLGKK